MTRPQSCDRGLAPTATQLHFRHLATSLHLWPVVGSCGPVTVTCDFPNQLPTSNLNRESLIEIITT